MHTNFWRCLGWRLPTLISGRRRCHGWPTVHHGLLHLMKSPPVATHLCLCWQPAFAMPRVTPPEAAPPHTRLLRMRTEPWALEVPDGGRRQGGRLQGGLVVRLQTAHIVTHAHQSRTRHAPACVLWSLVPAQLPKYYNASPPSPAAAESNTAGMCHD